MKVNPHEERENLPPMFVKLVTVGPEVQIKLNVFYFVLPIS